MRGRDYFSVFKPLLNALNWTFRWLPQVLFAKSWWLVEWIPGLPGIGLRYIYLRRLARSCGDNVLLGPGVYIEGWDRLRLGSNVSIHRGCYIDAKGGVSIGDDVSIAHHSSLVSFEHQASDTSLPIKDNPLKLAPIIIQSDVWIGAGVRILAGSVIGPRAIVGAGAVVKGDLSQPGSYVGVPARPTRPSVPESSA